MLQEIRAVLHGRVLAHVPLIAVVFFVPVFYTLLFGAVYVQNSVTHIPLVILDEDQTNMSRTLVRLYSDSQKFTIVKQTQTSEEMEAVLHEGRAVAALAIPRDFQKDIRMGNQPSVGFMVRSANNVFGNVAMLESWEINRNFSVAVGKKLIEGLNMLPDAALAGVYPVQIGVRVLGNPTGGFPDFILTGLSANGTQIALMITLTPLLHLLMKRRRWEAGHGPRVFLSFVIAFLIMGLGALLLSLFLAECVYAVPMRGSWLALTALSVSFLVFVIGVLCLFAVLSPDPVMAAQLPLFYIMPSILYSGITWPQQSMSAGAAFYADLMPMRYFAEPLRSLMLYGETPALGSTCGQMLFYGIICLLIAGALFIWRWRRYWRQQPAMEAGRAS